MDGTITSLHFCKGSGPSFLASWALPPSVKAYEVLSTPIDGETLLHSEHAVKLHAFMPL